MIVMDKLDMIKAYPEYYKAKAKPNMVNLEPCNVIGIKGKSAPEDFEFTTAAEELYSLCYTIKFISKANELDFVVPKMEGYWWVEGDLPFEETPRDEWCWRIVFRMPDFVGKADYEKALSEMSEKGKLKRPSRAVFDQIHEGLSAQILHTGSYDAEGPTLEALYAYIHQQGFEISGYHHEIYLNDPRKVPEDRLKTILRYSVA